MNLINKRLSYSYFTTRKKVNSGGQIGAVGLELPPLPRLPAVMSAVQTAAVSLQRKYENMHIAKANLRQ
jgi:hypothetical protein